MIDEYSRVSGQTDYQPIRNKHSKGRIAYTPLEAKNAALAVAYRGPWMLKAQIQSGARNHGRFLEKSAGPPQRYPPVKHRREIMEEAGKMLGATLVTPQ